MKEYLSQINTFLKENKKLVIATVVKTWGSAPRQVGACMIVSDDGDILGSVSGGCVEGAVLKKAAEVFTDGQPQYLKFNVSDNTAWSVGLSCGGALDVFVEMFLAHSSPDIWRELQISFENNKRVAIYASLAEKMPPLKFLRTVEGKIIGNNPDVVMEKYLDSASTPAKTQTFELENQLYLTQVFPKKSKLIIIGSTHITVDLVAFAHDFDFETIVIDPRGVFTEKINYPVRPSQMITDWPAEILPAYDLDESAFGILLTHDPKIDDQAMHIFLNSEMAYIGALGSKKSHEKRVQRLKEAGFSEDLIRKIHAPIGLDIHARTAKEISLSIMAELIKIRNE